MASLSSSLPTSSTDLSYTDIFPQNVSSSIIPKNSLFNDIKKNKCIQLLITELNIIPDINKYRNDLELITYCVNLVENLITEKSSGNLKKEIVMTSFQKIFSLNALETKLLSEGIDFLSNNNKIKKISIYKKYGSSFYSFLKKKFL